MSAIVKKSEADKTVFKHNPKNFKPEPSDIAKDFVTKQIEKKSEFKIADTVAQQSGIRNIQRQNIETAVEETVLERLKEIKEQAYKQAYDLGLHEGREKAFEENKIVFQSQIAKFDEILKSADEKMITLAKSSEAGIMKIIFEIAERIAMRAIKDDQAPILQMLTNLVTEVQAADNIVIKLNPDDAKFIEDLRQKSAKQVEALKRAKVEPSDEIASGGCIFITNYGAIDATVKQRVDQAWQIIESKIPVIDGGSKT